MRARLRPMFPQIALSPRFPPISTDLKLGTENEFSIFPKEFLFSLERINSTDFADYEFTSLDSEKNDRILQVAN